MIRSVKRLLTSSFESQFPLISKQKATEQAILLKSALKDFLRDKLPIINSLATASRDGEEGMLATLAMIIYPDIFKRVEWNEDFSSAYEAWRDVLYRYKSSRMKKLANTNFAVIITYLVDDGHF